MSKIKNRLLQLIESKNISKREFCRKIDVSHTYLNGDSEVGSDKLEVIISIFPEVSLEWLLTGRGDMFKSANPDTDLETERLKMLLEKQIGISDTLAKTIARLEKDVARLSIWEGEEDMPTDAPKEGETLPKPQA